LRAFLGLVFLLAVGLLDWALYIFVLRSSSLSDRTSPGTVGGARL
jgi:hypothetical protein